MGRVIPISLAHRYRHRRRNRAARSALAAAFGIALIAVAATQHPPPPSLLGRDAQLPGAINGGAAWRGYGKALAPRRDTAHAAALSLSGRVTKVRDGDTIVVGQTPVRIANLDCAEKGTPRGDRATRRVKALVAGDPVSCKLEGRRSYDREIGRCSMQDGRDLGAVLVQAGLCDRWRG